MHTTQAINTLLTYKTKIQQKNVIMWNAGFKGELKIRVKTTKISVYIFKKPEDTQK